MYSASGRISYLFAVLEQSVRSKVVRGSTPGSANHIAVQSGAMSATNRNFSSLMAVTPLLTLNELSY